jgi:hypothetical protein
MFVLTVLISFNTKLRNFNFYSVQDPSLMPVAVNVMQKGSSVDNDDFGCGKVYVHLLRIYELTLLLYF